MPRLNNFAITYHNEALVDGAGSQLYRIYGIYALTRLYHVSYYHSPIQRIGYQGVLLLEKNEENLELTQRYNETFHIPSDVEVPADAKVIDLCFIEKENLAELIEEARSDPSKFFLVKIAFANNILDKKPSALAYARAISPFKKKPSPLFRIAIHVRWGDLPIGFSQRLLPNRYYIMVAQKIMETLERAEIPYVCELHTELPSKSFTVTPNHYGVEGRLKEPMLLDPEQYKIEDFNAIANLKKWINHDPIETLEKLATADIVVMSISSFSFLAAMLNETGTAVYFPFFHSPMPGWLQHFPSFLFDEQLEKYCKQWQLKRASRSA